MEGKELYFAYIFSDEIKKINSNGEVSMGQKFYN